LGSKLIRNPDNRASAGLVQSFAWKMSFYSADANQRIDAALIEGDATRRAQMYEGLQRTMMQEGPAAYLFSRSSWTGSGRISTTGAGRRM